MNAILDVQPSPTPNALGSSHIDLRTRLRPVPVMRRKKKGSKQLYVDPKGKETTESETIKRDAQGNIKARYPHKEAFEAVEVDGKPVLDHVESLTIRLNLVDDTKIGEPGFHAGQRQGGEADVPDHLKPKWQALIVETELWYATQLNLKPHPDAE